jgi:hypothetical protein
METDETDFFIEGQTAAQSDLKEGHYVVVVGDLGSLDADEVYYRSNLKGPVSAPPNIIDPLVGLAEVTVLGQTVLTSVGTRFDGVLLEDIVAGDELEVSGAIDGDGRVIATYIELESGLTEYKAIGFVVGLDTAVMTFDLGGLAVDYSSAILSEFEGASLANGQLVEVRLDPIDFMNLPPSALVAEVELLPVPRIEEGAEVEVEGYIDSFSSSTDFTVNGLAVTTDGSTTFVNGDVGSLGLNVKVEVEGVANAAGVINAEQVEFKQDNAIRVEGDVTAVTATTAASGTVVAMGVTFEVRASTELEDDTTGSSGPFTMNDLMVGDRVEVRGFLDGATIVAVELEREDPDTKAMLRGPLTLDPDPMNNVLEIQGVTVTEQDGITEYEGGSRAGFYALLNPGDSVKAEWDNFTSLVDIADDLSLEED